MSEASYRDVMLDWAVAELMSPHWSTVPDWIWANPGWAAWRDHVHTKGPASWTAPQENTLIRAIEVSREPVLKRYGPRPELRFERQLWAAAQLGALDVMPDFFPPGGTLEQLSRWIAATPAYAPEKSQAIEAIKKGWRAGNAPFGSLIVVTNGAGKRILVEGYKRGLAALSAGRDVTPVYLCYP